ncbi:tryptophan--tRNA ligase [Buchnera aphidicola]|uniref:tryptophan--tRNA ligase n=1 Tax=Buchnera aphidicola TaxID=9 RepID=UPI0030ED1579
MIENFFKKKRVFSAIQPSGNLTIGNYISVLKYWKNMQKKYDCIFCIADLHSLTSISKNFDHFLNNSILDTLSLYLACGVNPRKSIVFLQSMIPEHTQLNWILNNYVYVQELMRMTQFKSKSKLLKNSKINSGILNYPILMASDILLYDTDLVHVGKDQIQHIELSKKIANRFNKIHGKIFKIPNFLIFNQGIKIMSLLNPNKKMSKSDINKKNSIFLLDDLEVLKNKVNSAITDSDVPAKIIFDPINKPGISNLLVILSSITKLSILDIEQKFFKKNYKSFKKFFYFCMFSFLKNLQKKFLKYRKDENKLKKILNLGMKKISFLAKSKINKIFNTLYK